MLTYEKFIGLNNVQPAHRLKSAELYTASDVDIGMDSELRRRKGYSLVQEVCHKNLHQAPGFMLATCNGDLCRTDGVAQTLLYPSIGTDRVWYCDLPDGRTTFSNGLIHGITDGTTTTEWGVPLPPSIGALTPVSGQLHPGDYQYAVTYVRISDGLEGGPSYSNPVPVPDGGILLTGLPEEPGYMINVYLSGHNGGEMYKAGSTFNSSFGYLGTNAALTLPIRTDFLEPMPVGTVTAFWRGRVLVADGAVLWASKTHQPELCDKRRDFKQFSAPITLIQPVDNGVFVGTTEELAFLAGDEFDKLVYRQAMTGRVVLGSGVAVKAEQLQQQKGSNESGSAMVCIADGVIVFGYNGGSVRRVTEGRYRTAVAEVAATFRVQDGIPQYIAVPL